MLTDPGKALFVKLFHNHITLDDDSPVKILTEFEPNQDFTDGISPAVLTMSRGRGQGLTDSKIIGYADRRVRWNVWSKGITLHVWAINNEIRDHVVMRILNIVNQAKMNNYQYCNKYDPLTQKCSTTNSECDALTVENIYGTEGLCPYLNVTDEQDPNYRNPGTWFTEIGIRAETLIPSDPTDVDQLNFTPPLYHSTIGFDNYIYDEFLEVNSIPFTDFHIDINPEEHRR